MVSNENSEVKTQMKYYINPSEDIKKFNSAIENKLKSNIKIEDITLIDPCM
jgi:hypothetical protein